MASFPSSITVYLDPESVDALIKIKELTGTDNTSKAVQVAVKLAAISLSAGTLAVTDLPIKQPEQQS